MSWVAGSGLLEQLKSIQKDYEAALGKNDLSLAGEKAAACARISRALEGHYPNQGYAREAQRWEGIAAAIKEGRFRKAQPVKEGGKEKETGGEGSFDSYIESLITTSEVKWEDIGGLEDAKALLRENVVVAIIQRPESIRPEEGILLFGPPGTGKTLLAQAVAGNLKATFFSASRDKLLSKYYGESSKLIATLYRLAWQKAEKSPAIIFIDEFDDLAISRDGEISEASRGTLGTLLAEIQGFRSKKSDRLVLTLVNSNTPWDLDKAILSRFPMRVYVRLPDAAAIADIIKIQTKGLDTSGLDLAALARRAQQNHFSGRELAALCRQAARHMVRQGNPNLLQLSGLDPEEIRKRNLRTRPLREEDFGEAFAQIKSNLTPEELKKYDDWAAKFGSN
ncbi:MAG: ATP-binding protein [Chloroflexi bacterium]|nr:ATP-binding protein [Chloroflexota bacterium]